MIYIKAKLKEAIQFYIRDKKQQLFLTYAACLYGVRLPECSSTRISYFIVK